MMNNIEPFKELYYAIILIRDLPERNETLIGRALELALDVEHAYKLVKAENDELSGKYNGCGIKRNVELTKKIEVIYGDLEDEVKNLTSYIDKADQEHIETRNELDKANTDLVRAYVQIGKAYMRAVEDSEHEQ